MRIIVSMFALTLVFLPGIMPAQDRQGVRERIMREVQEAQKNAPQVGEMAPEFKLKTMDGNNEETLTGLRSDRPVVLLFGSYT